MNIGVFGLGEAGSVISADIAATGIMTTGYDPAEVNTPAGVVRVDNPAEAVIDADVVIAITGGTDAIEAMEQALEKIPSKALYADFSTNTVLVKQSLAESVTGRGIDFVDVALMGTVPGKGISTSVLASGNGAARFMEIFSPLAMPVNIVSDIPGDAAKRKLLRSIMMKGLAATVIEAMRGAEKAGCADWLWDNLADEFTRANGRMLLRLIRGTGKHSARRLYEMEASLAMLNDLGVEPVMTRATVENIRRISTDGLPRIPVIPD